MPSMKPAPRKRRAMDPRMEVTNVMKTVPEISSTSVSDELKGRREGLVLQRCGEVGASLSFGISGAKPDRLGLL